MKKIAKVICVVVLLALGPMGFVAGQKHKEAQVDLEMLANLYVEREEYYIAAILSITKGAELIDELGVLANHVAKYAENANKRIERMTGTETIHEL